MGLQSQLNDVASDSIPIFFLSLIAVAVGRLRSFVFAVFHSVGLHRREIHHIRGSIHGLLSISDHLSFNAGESFNFHLLGGTSDDSPDCVFCLCKLTDGDRVRRLDCRHVFHKDCLDRWIDQKKFICPLCRSPLVPLWRVDQTQRRVGGELLPVR